MKEIYLGGGCFWGMEAYFKRVKGILDTKVGYGNSCVLNPSYRDVCSGETGAVEALYVKYDENVMPLERILYHFFQNINPTTLNRQGNDIGTQYRSGIYYVDEKDLPVINDYLLKESKKYSNKIVTEVKKMENFYPAEEYHQSYLEKNPEGYCHNLGAILDLKKTEDYKEV
ncbi:MAG: peptide-methionine (S)-S-oxide reductase MsrA [Cetobacterium sp.]|uniref:peptide-methionine (S)-S-oxide reductase MsrA n=1 Tax=Cetobacterium sp. TaxID=2071632 RepID=UPI003F37B273